MIYRFDGIYEPSSVLYLSGTSFLVVEDEPGKMLHFFQLVENGKGELVAGASSAYGLDDLDDLEGLALRTDGSIIAVASHSRQSDGKRSDAREQFVQFFFDGKEIAGLRRVRGLRESLQREVEALGLKEKDVDADLNIEGIAISPSGESMLLGLRSPLVDGKAIVLNVENISLLFGGKSGISFARPHHLLDLGGGGIRGMTWDKNSGYYYFTNEVENKKGKLRSRLYRWQGTGGSKPERLTFPGLKKLKNIEGLSFFHQNGELKLLLVCDDGDPARKKTAHYAIVRSKELLVKE